MDTDERGECDVWVINPELDLMRNVDVVVVVVVGVAVVVDDCCS